MRTGLLFELGEPCFFITHLNDARFSDMSVQLRLEHPSAVVTVIRGAKSRTVEDFFNEVSAALQFPYYFGENWDALDECITDLDWLPADAYVLFLSNVAQLLADADPRNLAILVRILLRANREWLSPNQYMPRNRPPTPFHVVLQCCPDGESLLERLEEADIAVNSLVCLD